MIDGPILPHIDHEATRFILENLREADQRELDAAHWPTSTDARVETYMNLSGFTFFASHDGAPAALIGASAIRPGVWGVYAFGTDAFRAVALTLTKFSLRVILPTLIKQGAHRAQCDSIEGHDDAHRWLESMGYEAEGAMPGYGGGGETFIRFARTEMDNVRKP